MEKQFHYNQRYWLREAEATHPNTLNPFSLSVVGSKENPILRAPQGAHPAITSPGSRETVIRPRAIPAGTGAEDAQVEESIPDYCPAVVAGLRRYAGASQGKRTTRLKGMLASPDLVFLMEAHSGLSATIVEEAGFQGIRASGLSIWAQLGVRDSNEASWTQVLDVADATTVPILLDADTGYGNFNNARRLVRKLEERGVAGCCIEDKCFPKTNSLLSGRRQPLADTQEFALKIRACKDHQRDPDFCVVARVEAFIAGWGLEEALGRAEAYREAGADAVLIHSSKADPSDIEAFMARWQDKGPVVIVPTKYYTTPTSRFRELGVSTVIWANHNLRASVLAVQETSRRIMAEQSLVNIEKKVASVQEIFRLQKDQELQEAEDKYLPKK